MRIFLSEISDTETALKVARRAGTSGLIFAGFIAIGAAFIVFGKSEDVLNRSLHIDEVKQVTVFLTIEIVVVLLLSWRVWSGQGFVSAIFLLLLFLLESIAKFVTGTSNIGWLIVYALLGLSILHRIRATWAYKKIQAAKKTTDIF